jgi:hypothetical protein
MKTDVDSIEFISILGYKVVLFGPLSRCDPKLCKIHDLSPPAENLLRTQIRTKRPFMDGR